MATATICTALLGLLVFGLGFSISLTRGSTQQAIGVNPEPTDRLYKLVRAHGNATEYAAMFAVLMLLLGMRGPATWVMWVMWVAVASRYLHAAGMILCPTLAKPHPLRAAGAVGTYVSGLALCVAVFLMG